MPGVGYLQIIVCDFEDGGPAGAFKGRSLLPLKFLNDMSVSGLEKVCFSYVYFPRAPVSTTPELFVIAVWWPR